MKESNMHKIQNDSGTKKNPRQDDSTRHYKKQDDNSTKRH